jgi:hypothetical protein
MSRVLYQIELHPQNTLIPTRIERITPGHEPGELPLLHGIYIMFKLKKVIKSLLIYT